MSLFIIEYYGIFKRFVFFSIKQSSGNVYVRWISKLNLNLRMKRKD